MGNFGFKPFRQLAINIRNRYHVTYFVETGTWRGRTVEWAANEFQQVITIEINKKLYQSTVLRLGHLKNVRFILSDSGIELPKLKIPQPAIILLDAHNPQKYDKASVASRCPLRQELEAVSSKEHFIFIDDARYLTGKGEWPGLDEVREILGDCIVWNDAVISGPDMGLIRRYAR